MKTQVHELKDIHTLHGVAPHEARSLPLLLVSAISDQHVVVEHAQFDLTGERAKRLRRPILPFSLAVKPRSSITPATRPQYQRQEIRCAANTCPTRR